MTEFNMVSEIDDKAGKQFWDGVWDNTDIPDTADPDISGWEGVITQQMHQFYTNTFSGENTRDKSFLELGCGGSIWLPYFAKRFGFVVSGIDYSEIGCAQERQILENADVEGNIVCDDFFKPKSDLHGKFDFVYSSGVAEHFNPTSECISAFAKFLKPGGTMLTLIPNLSGILGSMQKTADKEVYDIHVVLTADQLKKAHTEANLEIKECNYLLSTGFGILDTSSLDPAVWSTKMKRSLIKTLSRATLVVSAFENRSFLMPTSQFLSPFIACVSKKSE